MRFYVYIDVSMFFAVLDCFVLRQTVLNCTKLYCTVLYCTKLYYPALHHPILTIEVHQGTILALFLLPLP
jgi:hypothetical protein